MSNKLLLFIRIIGVALATSLFGTPVIAKTLIELNNRQQQSFSIAQKTILEAIKYRDLGNQKFTNQDYQGALADYNRAIQIDPNFTSAYTNRGLLKQLRLEDRKGALADFNRAIQIDPSFSAAYNGRGVLKILESDYKGALIDLNRAVQLNPDDIDGYASRALVKYNHLRDRVGGISDLQKVAKLLQKKGKQAEAQRYVELAKKWQAAKDKGI